MQTRLDYRTAAPVAIDAPSGTHWPGGPVRAGIDFRNRTGVGFRPAVRYR